MNRVAPVEPIYFSQELALLRLTLSLLSYKRGDFVYVQELKGIARSEI